MYVHKVKAEAAAAQHILRQLQATHDVDEDTRQIVTESETDLVPAIEAAIDRRAEVKEMMSAIQQRISDLDARLRRLQQSLKSIDSALQLALEATGQARIETAVATIYLQANPVSVVITDPARIPAELMRIPEPQPDKAAIKKKLQDGERVQGAELSNRMMSVRIKTR